MLSCGIYEGAAMSETTLDSPLVRPSNSVEFQEVKAGTETKMQLLIGSANAPNFALRRFVMQPGGGMPKHTNEVEHEQYVLEGEAEVGIGDAVHRVKRGDVLYIPKGIPHWYRAGGKEAFEFLCIVPNLPDKITILDEASC
jgi:quercetin dioxygenase-like cupin family protein